MAKGKRSTETKAKENKVVTMPRRGRGKTEDGGEKEKFEPIMRTSALVRSSDRSGKNAETLEKEDYKGATKKLRHWVEKEVKEQSHDLARNLVETAKSGDVRCAAMVLSIMEKKKKGGSGDDGDEPSLAEQLMAGPTWEEVLEARRKAKEEEDEGEEEDDDEDEASSF
jgi:hypothetical protein